MRANRIASKWNHFIQQYTRRAQRGQEPNDRGYDRKVEQTLRRMKPEAVDELLNGDVGDITSDETKLEPFWNDVDR
ncbi:hypothetical protein SAMN05443244_1942 [Terriglobus roseus]|uniref:Uncharacterized protein n=1 Tax=Terriglobus roseus TaxID=392734 RepID=A0A1H4MHY8_9BACT|nr:hypothetical protein SAMN05443244_1942 [Terriglobus roseus]